MDDVAADAARDGARLVIREDMTVLLLSCFHRENFGSGNSEKAMKEGIAFRKPGVIVDQNLLYPLPTA